MKPSVRSGVAPFIVMDVLREANARAAAGEAIFHLEAGEPGGLTPAPIAEAARRALDTGRIGYTEALGLPALRARIARFYGERYGVDVAPERVIVTAGASAAFILAFLAAFDAGARVALAEPGYPAYRNILSTLGLQPVALNTTRATRYQPTSAHLDDAGPLEGLLVQSPANPTGAVLTRAELKALTERAKERALWLISDEIYHGITYGLTAETALAFDDGAITINSFSKYFGMTGFRIGWMIVPEPLIRPIERLTQNLFISPNSLSQYAALGAFEAIPELEARVAAYARNRAVLLKALAQGGVDALPPDGAFYIYADVSRFTNDSTALAAELLAKTGVAATPGTDFGGEAAHSALRFSFAGAEAEVKDAAARLSRFFSRTAR
jgi:aspartate/methionine/tyrosine aminotransferase